MKRFALFFLSLAVTIAVPPTIPEFRAALFTQEKFSLPVEILPWPEESGPEGTESYAVLEKKGRIVIFEKGKAGKRILLDISSRVLSAGWEEGLLGMALSPHFEKDKTLYIYYSRSNPRRTVLSRVTLKQDPTGSILLPNPAQPEEILTIAQPFSNHNGGALRFGPDGYLYLGTGDGGSAGDPHNNGQRLGSLKGKILRIDVSAAQGYSVPKDNPFITTKGAEPLVYAYGLRNPWRFSFAQDGSLIVADVGQNRYEEIDIIEKGGNYGWRIYEASSCYSPPKGCSLPHHIAPAYEYGREDGSSILGGFVYRGSSLPLRDSYIFGDSMKGRLYALLYRDGKFSSRRTLLEIPILVSSFGETHAGEILFLDLNGGRVFELIGR